MQQSVMDGVNRLTQLAGHNRLELLMFYLGDEQRFGINVFKVQEVIRCPSLTRIPHSSPKVLGIANIRGTTMPVIDLAMSINKGTLSDAENPYIIVTEYNRTIQGFLVSAVDRIVNMNWEEIKPPPKGMSSGCYLTAVTTVDEKFVEIIDVEKVLAEVTNKSEDISEELIELGEQSDTASKFILIVDDSSVARNQVKRALKQIGVEFVLAKSGREGLDLLQDWAENDPTKLDNMLMVISDVEMPEMDGYTLVTEIRKDPKLQAINIILHTSLSGVFNMDMVKKVGADDFIAKFDPDTLVGYVLNRISLLDAQSGSAG